MDKWIQEFRERTRELIEHWERAKDGYEDRWAYGARTVLAKFDRALEKHGNKCNTTAQPAPPAESLHEAAKRLCAGRACDTCPIEKMPSHVMGLCAVWILHRTENADAQIGVLRRWAAENPPKGAKPAKPGVCATCANDGVACGNCKHNPDVVDHFARRKDAPTPPDDGTTACSSCKYEDHDCDETPCVDCVHNDGEDEHYDPAQEPPKAARTYREDFDEKHPEAPRHAGGSPKVLLREVYKVHEAKMYEYSHTPICEYWDKPLGYWEKP